MKGTQAALGVGVGYLLGRRKKTRLAMMLAIGAAAGGTAGIGKLGPTALRQGTKLLAKSDLAGALGPQVSEIAETIRGDLLDASKAAAAAAVTSRLDSFSDNLHQRAETLRNPEAAVDEANEKVGQAGEQAGRTVGRAGQAAGRAGESLRPTRRRGRRTDDEDIQADDEQADDEAADYDEPEEPEEPQDDPGDGPGEGGRSQRRGSGGTRAVSDEAEEPEDQYDEEAPPDDQLDEEAPEDESDEPDEDAEEPAPRRRRTTRSPVARTGR
jgi:hypothetical protein